VCSWSCSPTTATPSWTGSPRRKGGKPPWPAFPEVDVSAIATGFGCAAQRVESLADLVAVLDGVLARLGQRQEPLVLEVAVHA